MSPAGSLLFSFKLSIGRVSFASRAMYTNEAIASFLPDERIDLTYAYYALPFFLIENAGENIYGAKLLNQELIRNALLVLPSLAEQHAIGSFLDSETAKIDALIGEQRRLIELLKEKRQAVISHAVTKGLDANDPLKDSGVELLGAIPLGWRAMTVTRVIERIEQGWSPECIARPADSEEWGVVKSGCVNRGVFTESENKALPEELTPLPEYEIMPGDILMSRASGSPELVGSTALVGQTRPRLMLSDKTFRIRLAPVVDETFFVYIFNSYLMRCQIEKAISGADGLANNLPQSALKRFWFALPPKQEQIRIAGWIGDQINSLHPLLAEAEHAIEILQERRSALISAAVTGKIDVRNYTPKEAA